MGSKNKPAQAVALIALAVERVPAKGAPNNLLRVADRHRQVPTLKNAGVAQHQGARNGHTRVGFEGQGALAAFVAAVLGTGNFTDQGHRVSNRRAPQVGQVADVDLRDVMRTGVPMPLISSAPLR